MPLMAYVPSRPARAGPAKVIATAIEVLARAVVPARRHCCAHRQNCAAPSSLQRTCHSCESRNRSAPLWIPAFAGMTVPSAEY